MIRWLKWLFVEDLGLKAVALAGAVVIWFFVNEELTDERTLRVPVTVVAPAGRVVSESDAVVVGLTVRGPRGKIDSLSARDVEGRYEIPQAAPDGRLALELQPEHFRLAASAEVHITKITPASLLLTLTRAYQKQLSVRVIPVGNPAEGVEVVGAEAEPVLVTVTGPEEALKDLDYIETEPIDISGRKSTVSARTGVANYVEGPDGPVRVHCAEQVTATIRLRAKPAERNIANVQVRTMVRPGVSRAVKVEPDRLNVRVRGDRAAVVSLEAADVLLFVDLTDGAEGGAAVPVRCELPAGVSLAEGFVLPAVRVTAIER